MRVALVVSLVAFMHFAGAARLVLHWISNINFKQYWTDISIHFKQNTIELHPDVAKVRDIALQRVIDFVGEHENNVLSFYAACKRFTNDADRCGIFIEALWTLYDISIRADKCIKTAAEGNANDVAAAKLEINMCLHATEKGVHNLWQGLSKTENDDSILIPKFMDLLDILSNILLENL